METEAGWWRVFGVVGWKDEVDVDVFIEDNFFGVQGQICQDFGGPQSAYVVLQWCDSWHKR